MNPSDLSPADQARFVRLSKRWAEQASAARHGAAQRTALFAKLMALAAMVATGLHIMGGGNHGA